MLPAPERHLRDVAVTGPEVLSDDVLLLGHRVRSREYQGSTGLLDVIWKRSMSAARFFRTEVSNRAADRSIAGHQDIRTGPDAVRHRCSGKCRVTCPDLSGNSLRSGPPSTVRFQAAIIAAVPGSRKGFLATCAGQRCSLPSELQG